MQSRFMFSLAACNKLRSGFTRYPIDPLSPYNLDLKSVNIKTIPDNIVNVLVV